MGPAELLLKVLPFDKSPRWFRTIVILGVGGAAPYYAAGQVLTGANTMQWTMPQAVFLALCAAGGLVIGHLAWTQGKVAGLDEKKYRGQLADEINESAHSLMKSTNRWYKDSLEKNRPEADNNWEE